jgi:hypothetical protein
MFYVDNGVVVGGRNDVELMLLPFSPLCYKVASQLIMDVHEYNGNRSSGCRKGQGYLIVAVVNYQPNHIYFSSSRR